MKEQCTAVEVLIKFELDLPDPATVRDPIADCFAYLIESRAGLRRLEESVASAIDSILS